MINKKILTSHNQLIDLSVNLIYFDVTGANYLLEYLLDESVKESSIKSIDFTGNSITQPIQKEIERELRDEYKSLKRDKIEHKMKRESAMHDNLMKNVSHSQKFCDLEFGFSNQ